VNAWVRAVPASYARATRADPGPADIDVALMRVQHAAYVQALRSLGFRVRVLDASDAHPDCVFVEDTAVISGGRALVTRSANPQRVGEHDAVAEALEADGLEVVRMTSGTLDGGDVLEVGGVLLVGRTARTDAEGVAALRRTFGPRVREVPMPAGVLHLKCVCSAPSSEVVLAVEGVELDLPGGVRIVRVPREEEYASNVVGVGRRVIVVDGYPAVHRALTDAGFELVPIDVSEVRKGDGALTCLSLRRF
jgi:dimethylargininase